MEEPWYSLHARDAVPAPASATLDDKPRFMREIRRRYGTERLSEADWSEIIQKYTLTGRQIIVYISQLAGDAMGPAGLVLMMPQGVDAEGRV